MIDRTTDLSRGCSQCGPNFVEVKQTGKNAVCTRCGQIRVANFFETLNS